MKFQSLLLTAILTVLASFQTGCEDEIKVNVDYNKPKLVVDAFINNLPQTQTITLSRAVNYFDTNTAPAITNAQVLLFDTTAGKPFFFQHTEKGKYQFTPNASSGDTFTIGHDYALFILVDGDTLASFCNLSRTATFDSIRLVDVEGNGPPINTTGYYVERYSGVNDFLRSFKKDEKIRLEIHSISPIAYGWFNLVRNENQNGGLFATPPANIFSNIIAVNKNPKNTLGGLFCMSAVVKQEILIPE